MSSNVVLGTVATLVTVFVGVGAAGYLYRKRRFWGAFILALAFAALLGVLLLTFFAEPTPNNLSVASAYGNTAGFAILALCLAFSLNDVRSGERGDAPVILIPYALLAAIAVPIIGANNGHLWFASVAVGSGMLVGVGVPLVARVVPRRDRARSLRPGRPPSRGTQSLEHILLYVPVALLLIASTLCGLGDAYLAFMLAAAFWAASLGSALVVRRSLRW